MGTEGRDDRIFVIVECLHGAIDGSLEGFDIGEMFKAIGDILRLSDFDGGMV